MITKKAFNSNSVIIFLEVICYLTKSKITHGSNLSMIFTYVK